jgi:tetratricopeptide (TPR) repeat protein
MRATMTTSAEDRIREATRRHLAGHRCQAEALCRAVLDEQPRHAGALHLLALMARAQGRHKPAVKLARMAVAEAPNVSGYFITLGVILGDLAQWEGSVAAFRKAARLDPIGFEANRNLGVASVKAGHYGEAVGPLQQAAALQPDDPEVWALLASAHHGCLDLPAAIECRRRTLMLRPDDVPAHSDLLVSLHYSADHSPEQLFAEHLAWARQHEGPILARYPERPFENNRDEDRPLRVGYLSGDFRDHPISRFFLPLLANHDRAGIAVYCYSDVPRPDSQTERFRTLAGVWRDVSAMDDDAVANAIRADRIDVLVDLAGHLDNRRLLVFARRPAPVQATYIGYSDTTGMRSIGYRITDDFHAPLGVHGAAVNESDKPRAQRSGGADVCRGGATADGGAEPTNDRRSAGEVPATVAEDPHPNPEYREKEPQEDLREFSVSASGVRGETAKTSTFHTEQLVRLPGCCWAYDAGDDPAPPEVNELPALSSGRVTFAVFNRLIKATPQMARLWSRVLQRVPNSRLLVLDSPGAGEASLRAALARLGLSGDIGISARCPRAEYLGRYHEVDIALDTHPYAGVTTTCDATWMGVPTVTLAGNMHVSRSGVSLLSAVGLPELIAQSAEEYVEIAVRLASDLPRLAALRAGLRERMRQSPLCDGRRLAREIEAAYRDMWRKWCEGAR